TSESGEPSGGGNRSTSTPTAKEETPEEVAVKIKEAEEVKAREVAKAEQEARVKAQEVKAKEEAIAKAKEEARAKAKEEAKVKKEEKEEEILRKDKNAAQGSHDDKGGGSHIYPAFAKPPPSQTPFHREGKAKVLVGTGAPTSEVDSVLGKVRTILNKERASLNKSDANFSKSDAALSKENPVFSEISSGSPIREPAASETEGETLAKSVPSHCGTGCALRPTVDKAIADYSSNLAEAARQVSYAFTDSRLKIYDHRLQPVGVTVNYTVDFVGFAGKKMILEWTLCSKLTGRPLPRAWWRNV